MAKPNFKKKEDMAVAKAEGKKAPSREDRRKAIYNHARSKERRGDKE